MKKKIFAAIFAVLLCGVLAVPTFAAKQSYPKLTQQFFVNDYADIIPADDEAEMCKQGEKLYNACEAQVVVATVETIGDEVIEDYAYDLANYWKLGDDEKDNGILLILSVKERRVRIEVGSGLEGALPDSKTGRILDTYGVDYFKKDEFAAGLKSVYNSLVNEVYIEYNLEPDADYEPVEEDDGISGLALLIILALIIAYNIWATKRGKFIRFYGGPGGFSGGGFSGGSSGGGFSGGGFSGGGGGFSGGGSSRGF